MLRFLSPRATATSTSGTSPFVRRHIGPSRDEQAKMLAEVGYQSLEELVAAALPQGLRESDGLGLPAASEAEMLAEVKAIAALNRPGVPMIGLGYHATSTPAVIRRNVLENPAWYTAYTPYQPEISQGRLEALLVFQTLVSDLAGLSVANASLLDEATAVAEAVMVMRRTVRDGPGRVVVDADVLPQTLAVLRTRVDALGIDVVVDDLARGLPEEDFFGLVLQFPSASGRLRDVRDVRALAAQAHERGAQVTVATDLLALTLLKPPGECGADVVVGSSQRFGVPMGYGGPHAAFMAVRDGLERNLPGRLVGVSVDADGQPAYRLALQTREQHIRRDKATSNICTAQVLLAVVAAMYAVYHGPDGLRAIARHAHRQAARLAQALGDGGVTVVHDHFFDTLLLQVPGRAEAVVTAALAEGVQLRLVDEGHVGVSCAETTTDAHLSTVLKAFGIDAEIPDIDGDVLPAELRRTSDFLRHPVFNEHRSETAMMRYLRRLSDRDFALDRGMIPLGSCTMKLNSAAEMEPISYPEFADVHPFAPVDSARGYARIISELEHWLAEMTGYAKVSIQPNAGSQGELAGLFAIRAYHRAMGEAARDVCLIPSSAHGTNAASAVLAGMRVVVVDSRRDGTVDLGHLRRTCEEHRDELAAIMVTYPSTHGVYEDGITELCEIVHRYGGQVYIDGANLNALLGVAKPGHFGGDVSHFNLHKTFCIPHGGGGPGVGPVGAAAHLVPHLPSHPLHSDPERCDGIGPVSAAPYGSAGILPISWAYVRMMGAEGLAQATRGAILAANYVAARLDRHFPVLYTGKDDLVAHECILDLGPLTKSTGITVEDVAKRLIDYGFHAPTMSFPVAGTLMVEPTESEDLRELDRFCDAMIAIRKEIDAVADGTWAVEDSPLRGAPHTARALIGAWDRPYSREQAVAPAGDATGKYWPPVSRIEGAYGDRNLVCSCPPPDALAP